MGIEGLLRHKPSSSLLRFKFIRNYFYIFICSKHEESDNLVCRFWHSCCPSRSRSDGSMRTWLRRRKLLHFLEFLSNTDQPTVLSKHGNHTRLCNEDLLFGKKQSVNG